jgi:hypothetical protein
MPDREDEFWASTKEDDLRYCYKHKHYYRGDIGCQFCGYDNVKLRNNSEKSDIKITLLICPSCSETSLFWLEQIQVYECMNFKCRMIYSMVQYQESQKSPKVEPLGKAWFGNEYYDTKKKKWRTS